MSYQYNTRESLGFFKLHPDVLDPKFSTSGAACFDIHAYLKPGMEVNGYNERNIKTSQIISGTPENALKCFSLPFLDFTIPENSLMIPPSHRIMVPTGLILDIPFNHSVRVHSRSSMALKQGIRLANSEGVIDYDYFDPFFVLLHNTTNEIVFIEDGQRIAQLEMVPLWIYDLREVKTAPKKKGDREGGWGSTGR